MRIETKYREGLKHLMKEKPLDEINVVMLCDKVKSNRQTFYYHYRDLSDVIESMFLQERVGYGVRLYDFESIIKPLFSYINSNFNFLYAVANSFASDNLESFFYTHIIQKSGLLLKQVKSDEQFNQLDNLHVNRYVASLISKELVFWILNKRKEKQTLLLKNFKVIWNYFTNVYPKEAKNTK